MSSKQAKEEYNIQEAWDRVCTSFAESTKINLTDAPKYSIDEVVQQIQARQDEDNERNAKYKAAKDAIGKTVKCIQLLGGIAAQGASMVFAPSSLCFNAISYLLNAGMKYKRIFSSLSELFRRVSDVLERCKVYMRVPPNTIDVSLRKIINQELLCFVDICALSIKVLRGNKIFTALKVLAFDSDEGVSGQLARLADLVEREDQMRSTLGFEKQIRIEGVVLETADGTRKIAVSMDRVLSLEEKRDLENAQRTLLSDIDSSLDNASNEYKQIEEHHRRTLNERVQGTGKWLHGDRTYLAWAGAVSSPFSIMGLSGDQGHGKSFLCATILENLQEAFFQVREDLSCTSCALYTFSDEKTSLIKALKVISWQFASTDIVYRKIMSSVKSLGINDLVTLWKTLFGKLYKRDASYFILLDGVENIDKKHYKEFVQILAELRVTSASWQRFKLRILLSGRDEAIHKIQSDLGENNISVIDVASKNQDDMKKFIEYCMDKMPMFETSLQQPDILGLRKMILQSLTQNSRGDFVNTSLILDEVSTKQRPTEIKDILTRSRGNRSDTIARNIELLNEALTPADIADLNEILTWVVFAKRLPYLEELEAVIRFRSGETCLWPLADKITKSYSSILRIHFEQGVSSILEVGLVSPSIEDFLRLKASSASLAISHGTAATETVHEIEVSIVRRFLESVCDPKLYSKFGFEEFFQQKLKGNVARVAIDPETAHATILTTCLEVILTIDLSNSHRNRLFFYTDRYFAEHLKNVDLSLIPPELKIRIGLQLVRLFTDYRVIEQWCGEYGNDIPWSWIYDDQNAEAALRWLQESVVIKALSIEQRQWVKRLSSKAEPDADILENITRYLARIWLQGDRITPAFPWVQAYFAKIQNRNNPQINRPSHRLEDKEFESSQIFDTAKWAQSHIGWNILGYEGSCSLAHTLRECGKVDEAIEQFKICASIKPESWESKQGLGYCYASEEKYDLAINSMNQAVSMLEEAADEGTDKLLLKLQWHIAEWNADAGRTDIAIEKYQSLMQKDPEFMVYPIFDVIKLLHDQRDYGRLSQFLQGMNGQSTYLDDPFSENNVVSPRVRVFVDLYEEVEFVEAIFAMACNDKGFDIARESYQGAISVVREGSGKLEIAGTPIERSHEALLTHYLAMIFYSYAGNDREKKEYALDIWTKLLQLEETADDFNLPRIKQTARTQLASAYFNEAQLDPGQASPYLEQLEQLATLKSDDDHRYKERDGTYPIQLIARYHALHGDEESAINVLRLNIKLSLDILVDDDPLNDWQGYRGLAKNFMYAGQDDDSLAAWSLITPQEGLEPEQREVPTSVATGGQLTGPLRECCFAGCETWWKFSNDMYICRTCDSVMFDLRCLEKLREGSLDSWCCNKNHDMLHIPAYDPVERHRIGDGNVRVGQEVMKVDDWLRRIRQKWGIKEI